MWLKAFAFLWLLVVVIPEGLRAEWREEIPFKMMQGFGMVVQGGVGPVWDGKTVPKWEQVTAELADGKKGLQWKLIQPGNTTPEYGQPPRIIRVTYKVNRDQMLGNKPITDKDIVPNDTDTTIMLK